MDEQTPAQPNDKNLASEYRGLETLLHAVRWTQHLLAIIAEVLILLSFAMSGMDVSLGGVLAEVPFIKVLWAGMFALGIDTAFVLSWVRLRQCVMRRQWLPFIWNLLLALSMAVIIFQPLAIQLLQESLSLSFNQAVASLGINIVFLTYARSGVAVFLGAILAMTNVESDFAAQAAPARTQPKRQFILIERLFQKVEPARDNNQAINSDDTMSTQSEPVMVNDEPTALELVVPAESSVTTEELVTAQAAVPEQQVEESAQTELPRYDTPEQRAQKVSELDFAGLSAPERVAKVLEFFPDLSDGELGKLSGMSAATAKKHREALETKAAREVSQ